MRAYLGLAVASIMLLGACDTSSRPQAATVVDSLIGT